MLAETIFISIYLQTMYFLKDVKTLGAYGTENQKGHEEIGSINIYSDDMIIGLNRYEVI